MNKATTQKLYYPRQARDEAEYWALASYRFIHWSGRKGVCCPSHEIFCQPPSSSVPLRDFLIRPLRPLLPTHKWVTWSLHDPQCCCRNWCCWCWWWWWCCRCTVRNNFVNNRRPSESFLPSAVVNFQNLLLSNSIFIIRLPINIIFPHFWCSS